MTREETKEAIAVMQAYVDGQNIEFKIRIDPNDPWGDNSSPTWNWDDCNYRVAQDKAEQAWANLSEVQQAAFHKATWITAYNTALEAINE